MIDTTHHLRYCLFTDGEKAGRTGRIGTAGVSSRVTSVAGADGFSVKPTTKLEFQPDKIS